MKTKLLSLLLVVTLLAVTISTGLPTSIFAESDNLIENGQFDYNGGSTIDGWKLGGVGSTNTGAKASVEKNVKINDDLTANAIKFTTSKDSTSKTALYNANTIKIERNASYTMTFWVKAKNIKGFRAYMYEPNYIDLNGVQQTKDRAAEGQNIYTYSYSKGPYRVIRTDVTHSWTIAQTGNAIDSSSVSMFISRVNNVEQVLTSDYPNTEKEGEWLQVVHKFATGNLAAHTADVKYEFNFPAAVDGEVWIADVRMSVVKSDVDDYYTPAVNDELLGSVSKDVPLINGKNAELTAEPFGENKFDGWFVDGELVSEETSLSFTYDAANPPKYEARFTKGEVCVENGSFETGYTNAQLLAKSASQNYTTDKPWTESLFKESSLDGENKFFLDSEWVPYGEVYASTDFAHTGKFSIKNATDSRAFGYKITNLTENTEYSLSFYVMTTSTTQSGSTLDTLIVTDSNMSCMAKNAEGKLVQRTVDLGALAKKDLSGINCRNNWQKAEITFNSKNSKEVIVWLRSAKSNTVTYVDSYSIKRVPAAFKPESNDANLGFASPAEGITCLPGDEVTFTATPLEGNYFDGWYVGDKLVSKDAVYTFTYSVELQGLKAHFKAGDTVVPNASFEDAYTDGQVLAQATHKEPIKLSDDAKKGMTEEQIAEWKTDWTVDSWKNTTKDGVHFIESSNGGTFRQAKITSSVAHTGKNSIYFDGKYGSMGKKFTGLKKNTTYVISFYGMIGDKNYDGATFGKLRITKANEGLYNAEGSEGGAAAFIAGSDKTYTYYEQWGKASIEFNSGDNTEVILWINHNKLGVVYLDDFSIFEPISGSVSADLGGTVTSNITSKNISKGSYITASATPLEGNTFAGWYDMAGKPVSDKADYSFVADGDFALLAKFDGYNKPATDLFATNGNDGTFENGTVSGWFYYHEKDSTSWCEDKVTSKVVYDGEKSLEIAARYRNALLPLTGLVPNSDYRLSFYINQPDDNTKAKINNLAVIGENDLSLSGAGKIFTSVKLVASNSGWNKIDLYFNSGSFASANFFISYVAETLDGIKDKVYIDNMSLYRYAASDDVLNGSFDEDKAGWIGDGSVVVEDDNKVMSLNKGNTVYQNINVEKSSAYTVSFKAKGKLTAATLDLAKFSSIDFNIKNYLSSVSYVEADGSEWTEYSYKFYTGVHESVNLAFKASEDGAMIDDLVLTKEKQSAGSIIERIDFDSERFDLTSATDDSVFKLYSNEGNENDPYVYSGTRSLKFTYEELTKNVEFIFGEAYLSYQPIIGSSIKVSMKIKIPDGKAGGFVGAAPEYTGTYGIDTGFDHMSKTSEWQNVAFYINNQTHAVFKAKINSIAGSTAGDFYVDDIVIEVTPPMVLEENSKITYCERLYNAVKNESFEDPASAKDWANLPSTAKIVKGNALKGDYFLRAESGTHYVIPVSIEPNKEYYFAASVRGNAKTVGTIGVTVDNKGTEYYLNRVDEAASVVEFDSDETGWKRSGFKFTTDGEVAYLTIDVKAGALEIDSVMLFTTDYGYRFDPNDYTKYVPYDYDNLKSASTVINGGFGAQPYYKGTADEVGGIILDGNVVENGSADPSMGDSIVVPVITIILAVLASSLLMFIRKRKEGAENA